MIASKPAARALLAIGAALFMVSAAGCGYRPLYAPTSADPLGPFAVVGGPAIVAYARVIAAVEAGARSELARSGQLASCSPSRSSDERCSTLIIDVVRVEESPEGIALGSTPRGGEGAPLGGGVSPVARGRGLRLTITGRARVREGGGGESESARATDDVRASETIARGSGDLARFERDRDEALRAAATTLGERLVRRLLGAPDASDDD